MEEIHECAFGGHFCRSRLAGPTLVVGEHVFQCIPILHKACAECAIATGSSLPDRPPLSPIPVHRPFQVVGVYLLELLNSPGK